MVCFLFVHHGSVDTCTVSRAGKKQISVCCTFTGFLMQIVTGRADTPVGSIQIQTRSCTTCAWIHCTFINIWGETGKNKERHEKQFELFTST